jgi:hypothetical protein
VRTEAQQGAAGYELGTDQLEELRNESHVVEQVTFVDLELGDVLRLATVHKKEGERQMNNKKYYLQFIE